MIMFCLYLVLGVLQVRLQVVPDGSCLLSVVEYLYLDDVQQQDISHTLYLAALHCGLERLVTRCEAHYAHQLEVQLHSWPGGYVATYPTHAVRQAFMTWMVQSASRLALYTASTALT